MFISIAVPKKDKALCSEVVTPKNSRGYGEVTKEFCLDSIEKGRPGNGPYLSTSYFNLAFFHLMGYDAEDVTAMLDEMSAQWKADSDSARPLDTGETGPEKMIWSAYENAKTNGVMLSGYPEAQGDQFMYWSLIDHKLSTDPDFKNRLNRLPDFSTVSDAEGVRRLVEGF